MHSCIKTLILSLCDSLFSQWTGTRFGLTWLLKEVRRGNYYMHFLSWEFSYLYGRRGKKPHLLWERNPANDQVAAKSLKTALKKDKIRRIEESPLCYLHLAHPSNLIPFLLPSFSASFTECNGCISKSTIKFPFCLCGR